MTLRKKAWKMLMTVRDNIVIREQDPGDDESKERRQFITRTKNSIKYANQVNAIQKVRNSSFYFEKMMMIEMLCGLEMK